MWLSKRGVIKQGSSTDVGLISVESESPAVVTDGEWRNARVIGPGGYSWMPAAEESVLVLKDGEFGGAPCVVGTPVSPPVQLEAGEVCAGNAIAYARFQNDGTAGLYGKKVLAQGESNVTLEARRIDLNGKVYVNGIDLEVLLSGK